MPYYLTKVTQHLKNISKVSRPTFMIEQLSAFVLDKHSLLVAEWLQNILNAMENPQKFTHLILIQPGKKDELTASEASLILHLCPAQAVTDFINKLANPDTNWVEIHDGWANSFDNEEEETTDEDDEEEDDISSDDDLSDEDDDDDSMPELENVDSDQEIIYERVVLPWWNEDRAGLLRV